MRSTKISDVWLTLLPHCGPVKRKLSGPIFTVRSVPLKPTCCGSSASVSKRSGGSGIGDKKKGLFQGPVAYLDAVFSKIDREVDRHVVLAVVDDLRSEFYHYCLFADIYDSISGTKLNPQQLIGWEADETLASCATSTGRNGGNWVILPRALLRAGIAACLLRGCGWRGQAS